MFQTKALILRALYVACGITLVVPRHSLVPRGTIAMTPCYSGLNPDYVRGGDWLECQPYPGQPSVSCHSRACNAGDSTESTSSFSSMTWEDCERIVTSQVTGQKGLRVTKTSNFNVNYSDGPEAHILVRGFDETAPGENTYKCNIDKNSRRPFCHACETR
ncbi:hypothetical protein PGTUg99_004106 [Puccinia graminis f. sp. tritici]|uniref:Ig-like domain-containing protein n=1 Tax=Puccinia graminis f. sp. tritici TaxID=56615 RepID=A0A5B0MV60_PUCGR|nr:hypothetical protein PGTUg99_004106 [Puccinia graminis f. sp. tritici]